MRKEEMHDAAAIGDNREPPFLDQGDDAFHRLHAELDQVSRRPTYRQRRSSGKISAPRNRISGGVRLLDRSASRHAIERLGFEHAADPGAQIR